MSDLVERLRDDNSDYVYTERHEAAARITELETALAEAEGRVIAEVVTWLRRQAEEVGASRLHWNNREIIESTVANVATALETGEWKK